ncbi:hypothetical protein [Actinoplanes couchii]|uniref:Uncharacterized protein n=1 Tax=Actinoplanes couchii TaxID=403638 RepID=A0ABQ3XEX9_9ACTN|nr:hypothetical protein [Actinoplanes couchii]MDR6319910.1 hypothetical protein [Actinoplanes couchii]GID57047.1 hypothetical protein Aco03nite_054510 [Actinoplanes couchii]
MTITAPASTVRTLRSGVYTHRATAEELRIDVDGPHPTVSGTTPGRLTWIAPVTWDDTRQGWAGRIEYRDGGTGAAAHVLVTPAGEVTFSGCGTRPTTRRFVFTRSAFRTVGIEFDTVEGATAVTDFSLRSHPNRPAGLPDRTLTIEDVFTAQGIAMKRTGGGDVIPVSGAGDDSTWSDIELHDAMTAHWSRWADTPQWQVWTLFAGRHDEGPALGGIMFDGIGAAQRQGCAVFGDSFIAEPPPGDPNAAAAVRRMRFWTAVHEIGHCFNLAHSWQKPLGRSWIPLRVDPEARSFMNYPYAVDGGAEAFFSDFDYRFSDEELLFLRHAPEHLVQMGAAPWFDRHGFEQARRASARTLELGLRVRRAEPAFAALEPVVVEVSLTNTSPLPQTVDRNVLAGEGLTVLIEGDGREPRQWVPFARYCHRPDPVVLQPGESLSTSVFPWAGRNGFDLAEPGRYSLYAALATPSGDVLSAPLRLEIRPPADRQTDRLAGDVLTEGVGRVLAFGGSRGGSASLDRANDVLSEVAARMPASRIGVHAAAALGRVAARPGRVLTADRRFRVVEADPTAAQALLTTAYANPERAAETLGRNRL